MGRGSVILNFYTVFKFKVTYRAGVTTKWGGERNNVISTLCLHLK